MPGSERSRDDLILALYAVAESKSEYRWRDLDKDHPERKRLTNACKAYATSLAATIVNDRRLVDEVVESLSGAGGRRPWGAGKMKTAGSTRATPGLEAVVAAMRKLGLEPPTADSLNKVLSRKVKTDGATAIDAYLSLLFVMEGIPMSEVSARMDWTEHYAEGPAKHQDPEK